VSPVSETPYPETEALLAVMNGDTVRMLGLLADMLPGELRAFEKHLTVLRGHVKVCREQQDGGRDHG
jgi:hypothetical protein